MTKLTVLLSLALAGCARDPQSKSYAIPTASAAEIETALCPQHEPVAKVMTCPRETTDQ